MKIEVCAGSRCTVAGGDILLSLLEIFKEDLVKQCAEIAEDLVIVSIPCTDLCHTNEQAAPVIRIDGDVISGAKSQDIMSRIIEHYKL